MFCTRCGKQVADDDVFCAKCGAKLFDGKPTYEIANETTYQIGNEQTTALKKINWKSPKMIRGIIAGVVVICIIWSISYFNSATYLENKLIQNTWYQMPEYRYEYSYDKNGYTLEFHENGEVESEYFYYDSDDETWYESYDGTDTLDWELMDDKTLLFDGEYYEWGEEWSLSGNELEIGDVIYCSTDKYGYEDAE